MQQKNTFHDLLGLGATKTAAFHLVGAERLKEQERVREPRGHDRDLSDDYDYKLKVRCFEAIHGEYRTVTEEKDLYHDRP